MPSLTNVYFDNNKTHSKIHIDCDVLNIIVRTRLEFVVIFKRVQPVLFIIIIITNNTTIILLL